MNNHISEKLNAICDQASGYVQSNLSDREMPMQLRLAGYIEICRAGAQSTPAVNPLSLAKTLRSIFVLTSPSKKSVANAFPTTVAGLKVLRDAADIYLQPENF